MRSISFTYKLLSQAIILIVGAAAFISCAKDDFDFIDPQPQASSGLLITPQIYDQLATRAPSNYYEEETGWEQGQTKPADDALMENDLGTHLDVFISGIDDDYWKEFHLIQGETFAGGLKANVKDQVADLLTDAWKTMGSEGNPNLKLTVGNQYDVFVAVNNTMTNAHIGSKTALLNLVNHNANVYKLYGNQGNEYDQSRRMMMDGHVVWTLENDDQLQRIEVPLKRAEAKIVAKIQFDPAFYASLIDYNYVSSPIGNPAWKWTNWCFDSKVFADAPDITPTLQTNTGRNNAILTGTLNHQKYYHYEGLDAVGQNVEVYFTENEKDTEGNRYLDLYPSADERYVDGVPYCYIVTYDYCNTWGENAEELAPYMLLSYPFYAKESPEATNTITTFNYYRIPLCDQTKNTGLERNHIYKVEATISGSGSTSLSGRVNDVRLNYQVVDWTHNENEVVNILAEKFYYFYVTPKRYELRGNDTQTVDLAYYAPEGSVVQVRNVKIYYYNSSGTTVYQYGSNNTQLNNVFSSFTTPNNIAQPTSITVNADGTISISSEALANKAVKCISFTAFTTFVDENNQTQTLTEDVFIKHFPTDNIQNVEGWFSYKQDGGTTRTIREYSSNPEADGWDSWDGYESIEVSESTYAQATEGKYTTTTEDPIGTPSDHDRASTTQSGGNNSQIQTAFRDAVPVNSRQGANSESNAYKDEDSDYWYWGTGSTTNNANRNNYDWYTEGWFSNTYYRYLTYYRRIYYKNVTHYYANMYYRDVEVNTNWVIWDKDSQNRYPRSKTTADSWMSAKVFNGTIIRRIAQNGTNGNYIAVIDNQGYTYSNNHMYIIQIASTSDDYILGRPIVDATTHLSQDHVVSPAFMIASQLGAFDRGSSGLNGATAAEHCSQYVEVALDGTTYTGWRLPTKEEVSVIINYQYNSQTSESMAEVLTARNYYTLDGTSATNAEYTGSNGTFVRCVRDLSPAEVEAINSKE
ncbi:MAG: hypothetical protein IJ607_10755 [Bacteroidaceae bacterium]|nr:hypothetical protein [Bacteroidaceae bacterium]